MPQVEVATTNVTWEQIRLGWGSVGIASANELVQQINGLAWFKADPPMCIRLVQIPLEQAADGYSLHENLFVALHQPHLMGAGADLHNLTSRIKLAACNPSATVDTGLGHQPTLIRKFSARLATAAHLFQAADQPSDCIHSFDDQE